MSRRLAKPLKASWHLASFPELSKRAIREVSPGPQKWRLCSDLAKKARVQGRATFPAVNKTPGRKIPGEHLLSHTSELHYCGERQNALCLSIPGEHLLSHTSELHYCGERQNVLCLSIPGEHLLSHTLELHYCEERYVLRRGLF